MTCLVSVWYSSIRINASSIGSMQLILWVAACYSMLWDCISVIWLLLVLCTESDSMACLLMIGYPGELAQLKGAHNKAQSNILDMNRRLEDNTASCISSYIK